MVILGSEAELHLNGVHLLLRTYFSPFHSRGGSLPVGDGKLSRGESKGKTRITAIIIALIAMIGTVAVTYIKQPFNEYCSDQERTARAIR
jgi:hypothetical protein